MDKKKKKKKKKKTEVESGGEGMFMEGGVKRIPSRTITLHRGENVIMRRMAARDYPARQVNIDR